MARYVFSGEVASGKGEGKLFTRAEWVRAAFQELVAIDPWPGTFNLRVSDRASLAAWAELNAASGLVLRAPDAAWCDGRCYSALLVQGDLRAAIIVPEVASYPPDQVEIVAAMSIRQALGVGDGDRIEVEVTV
jgi:riboflavin kinase